MNAGTIAGLYVMVVVTGFALMFIGLFRDGNRLFSGGATLVVVPHLVLGFLFGLALMFGATR